MNLENKKIYDISPLISSKTAVFPGDMGFSRDIVMDFDKGDAFALSNIKSTVHIGAHVDAPNHYHSEGVGIDQRSLSFYIGKCQVIHLKEDLDYEIKASRVLFKTNSFPDPEKWNHDFQSLNPKLINYLSEKNVITVGIDTPSVDSADSKDLKTHLEIYKNNMAILEGIVLDEVPEGIYTLLALPLKIKDADASPVRAILLGDEC